MRKIYWFLLLLFYAATVGHAKDITPQAASQAAIKAMQKQVPHFSGNVQSITPIFYENVKVYYAINFEPKGWVLIAADDAVSPILGYSPNGAFTIQNMSDNCSGWLSNYSDEISRVIRQDNSIQHNGWKELNKISAVTRAADDEVAPLITVNWNQSKPYNKYCPSNSSGQAIVGCVAVAMAQAMTVCQYPQRPSGEYSYSSPNYGTQYINYNQEPVYNWNAILSGANNKDDVARLLWHCGVSIDMNYGVDGSGTQSSYIATALRRNFGYTESVKYYSRSGYSGDWKSLIVNELKGGRAVCYSGADLKKGYGHCFNLDGYDGNNMFHVNWGWGGANNGYFPLDGLKDATMDMDYTAQQGVVIGIRPPSDKPSDIQLSANTVKEKQPVGTVVAQVAVSSEATNPSYEYSLRGKYSPILHTYITVPFTIESGELKTTKELDASSTQEWTFDITVKNTNNGASYTKTFTIYVISASETELSPASGITLKYDKEKKILTLKSSKHVTYAFYTAEEDILDEGELNKNESKEIPLTNITSTSCSLQLATTVGSKTIRIILKKTE